MINQLLETISTQGLSGTLLVLALVVIFFLYKETKSERNARMTDIKQVWQEDIRFRGELKALLDTILEILRSKK